MSCARPKTMESKAALSRATSGMGEGWGEGRQDPGASYFRRQRVGVRAPAHRCWGHEGYAPRRTVLNPSPSPLPAAVRGADVQWALRSAFACARISL